MLLTSILAISLPMALLRSRSRLGRMAFEMLRSILLFYCYSESEGVAFYNRGIICAMRRASTTISIEVRICVSCVSAFGMKERRGVHCCLRVRMMHGTVGKTVISRFELDKLRCLKISKCPSLCPLKSSNV